MTFLLFPVGIGCLISASAVAGEPVVGALIGGGLAALLGFFTLPHWPWRRRRPPVIVVPPQNVRVEGPDGTEYPCSVLREPRLDRDGCAAWLAVVHGGRPLPAERGDWAVHCDVLPAKTILCVDFPMGAAGD